ncbi:hypothetical protein JCM10295v2_004509 [Rhodotorula toruloides]
MGGSRELSASHPPPHSAHRIVYASTLSSFPPRPPLRQKEKELTPAEMVIKEYRDRWGWLEPSARSFRLNVDEAEEEREREREEDEGDLPTPTPSNLVSTEASHNDSRPPRPVSPSSPLPFALAHAGLTDTRIESLDG